MGSDDPLEWTSLHSHARELLQGGWIMWGLFSEMLSQKVENFSVHLIMNVDLDSAHINA